MYFLPLNNCLYGYTAPSKDIVVNSRLHGDFQREVLAYELGHAHYGHDLRNRHDSLRDEARTDAYAARLLISPTDYVRAEKLHEGCVQSIATELGVSTKLVKLWRDSVKTHAVA